MKIGLFQGTFDPITKGHIDCIKRTARFCDKLYVLAAINTKKNTMFNLEERLTMMRECLSNIKNIEIDSYDGLTADYAKIKNVNFFIRGLRNFTDFDYERLSERYNKDIAPDIETLYLSNNQDLEYVSSSGVRELIIHNADISKYVEKPVLDMVEKKRKEFLDGNK